MRIFILTGILANERRPPRQDEKTFQYSFAMIVSAVIVVCHLIRQEHHLQFTRSAVFDTTTNQFRRKS